MNMLTICKHYYFCSIQDVLEITFFHRHCHNQFDFFISQSFCQTYVGLWCYYISDNNIYTLLVSSGWRHTEFGEQLGNQKCDIFPFSDTLLIILVGWVAKFDQLLRAFIFWEKSAILCVDLVPSCVYTTYCCYLAAFALPHVVHLF